MKDRIGHRATGKSCALQLGLVLCDDGILKIEFSILSIMRGNAVDIDAAASKGILTLTGVVYPVVDDLPARDMGNGSIVARTGLIEIRLDKDSAAGCFRHVAVNRAAGHVERIFLIRRPGAQTDPAADRGRGILEHLRVFGKMNRRSARSQNTATGSGRSVRILCRILLHRSAGEVHRGRVKADPAAIVCTILFHQAVRHIDFCAFGIDGATQSTSLFDFVIA